jgi:large subunit ribosomal protein L4
MRSFEVKNSQGKVIGSYSLTGAIASAEVAPHLLHKAVVTEEANARQGTQCAKTRAEVRGGGRKPYKQKKTGRARQGSIRAPQYRHGGVVFAPKPRGYDKKINKKEKRAALLSAIAAKFDAGDVTIVDAISLNEPKTKSAVAFLEALNLKDTRRVLLILPEHNEATYKSFRNLPNVAVRTAPSTGEEKTTTFSTRDMLVAHKVVVAQDALKKIEEAWSK